MTDESIRREETTQNQPGDIPEAEAQPPTSEAPAASPQPPSAESADNDYSVRLERLGGEPAPVITPEEFARLQKAGQVHIDARGRVYAARRADAEAGVSLRKRRAWYGNSGAG